MCIKNRHQIPSLQLRILHGEKKAGISQWNIENPKKENGHLEWIFPLKIVIFHCYVSSPEGKHF